jgi:hypothetical protein
MGGIEDPSLGPFPLRRLSSGIPTPPRSVTLCAVRVEGQANTVVAGVLRDGTVNREVRDARTASAAQEHPFSRARAWVRVLGVTVETAHRHIPPPNKATLPASGAVPGTRSWRLTVPAQGQNWPAVGVVKWSA